MTVKSNKFAGANSREFHLQIYWNSGANFWEKLLQKNMTTQVPVSLKKYLNMCYNIIIPNKIFRWFN